MKKEKFYFDVECTDTFAGEANYCWVIRERIAAVSHTAALTVFSRKHGGGWRFDHAIPDSTDTRVYRIGKRPIVCFVSYAD